MSIKLWIQVGKLWTLDHAAFFSAFPSVASRVRAWKLEPGCVERRPRRRARLARNNSGRVRGQPTRRRGKEERLH